MEIVKVLGLLPDYLDKSVEQLLLKLHNEKTIIKTWEFIQSDPKIPAVPFPNARLLGQATNEAILREHLAKYNVLVELGTELVSFEQDDTKVTVHLDKQASDGSVAKETLNVEWLIGSDGARGRVLQAIVVKKRKVLMFHLGLGVVRKQLGLSFLEETLDDQAFLVGDVEIEGIDREVCQLTYLPQHACLNRVIPHLCMFMGTKKPGCKKSSWALGLNILYTHSENPG